MDNDNEDGMWARIANTVMARPAVLIPTLIILLGAGLPFYKRIFQLHLDKRLPTMKPGLVSNTWMRMAGRGCKLSDGSGRF